MPYKDIDKRRENARKSYYRNKEKRKERFNFLPEFEKERIRCSRRVAHTKHYNKYKERYKINRKLTSDKVRLKSLYNLSIEEYNNLLQKQNNVCAICGKEKASFKNMTLPLCVDHNHQTNKVRGLLCNKCNSMIGLANESLEILKNAIVYLKNNE